MQEIKYFPVGGVKLTPIQKKDAAIRRLKHWVMVLAVADVLYTMLMGFMIYIAVAK